MWLTLFHAADPIVCFCGDPLFAQIGGTPAVLKYLLERNLIDGSCLTVTGACGLHLSAVPPHAVRCTAAGGRAKVCRGLEPACRSSKSA